MSRNGQMTKTTGLSGLKRAAGGHVGSGMPAAVGGTGDGRSIGTERRSPAQPIEPKANDETRRPVQVGNGIKNNISDGLFTASPGTDL